MSVIYSQFSVHKDPLKTGFAQSTKFSVFFSLKEETPMDKEMADSVRRKLKKSNVEESNVEESNVEESNDKHDEEDIDKDERSERRCVLLW